MSRTWKDRPMRVRLHENMKNGHIDHDHTASVVRTRIGYSPDRELSIIFYKWAQKEIDEHKAFLDSLGDEIVYEIEEKDSVRMFDRGAALAGFYSSPTYTLKTVCFVVRRVYTYESNDLCTDADHYDSFTKTDTRNGKAARCTPAWSYDLSYWGTPHKNAPTRASVKASLKTALDYANSEEFDEYYSDVTYEMPYGKKVWLWDD